MPPPPLGRGEGQGGCKPRIEGCKPRIKVIVKMQKKKKNRREGGGGGGGGRVESGVKVDVNRELVRITLGCKSESSVLHKH